MTTIVWTSLLALWAALFQSYPPLFPRDNAVKVVENDRKIVWDVSALKAGVPHKLFLVSPTGVTTDRNTWDVTPDGQRFLVNSSQQQQTTNGLPITVILNWMSKAKAN